MGTCRFALLCGTQPVQLVGFMVKLIKIAIIDFMILYNFRT
jgi:hypothetical protein